MYLYLECIYSISSLYLYIVSNAILIMTLPHAVSCKTRKDKNLYILQSLYLIIFALHTNLALPYPCKQLNLYLTYWLLSILLSLLICHIFMFLSKIYNCQTKQHKKLVIIFSFNIVYQT